MDYTERIFLVMGLSLLCIAGFNAITAYLTFRTHLLAKKIEHSSNSMKDELIEATKKFSYSEGHDTARIEGEDRAAALLDSKPKKTKY